MTMSSKRLFVNAITFARVPFVLLFMVLAIAQQYTGSVALALVAAASLAIAAITDLFDGLLARRWKVVSKFGAMSDPLMDKVFYLVVFPTILWLIGTQTNNPTHALVMLVFTVLYILRDQWVTFLRSVGALYQADCSATWLGKFRTASSFPAACVIYLYVAIHAKYLSPAVNVYVLGLIYVVEAALIVLNIFSMYRYTIAYMPYLRLAIGKGEDN